MPFCSCPLVNISEMDSTVVHSPFGIDPGVTCPLRAGIESLKSVNQHGLDVYRERTSNLF